MILKDEVRDRLERNLLGPIVEFQLLVHLSNKIIGIVDQFFAQASIQRLDRRFRYPIVGPKGVMNSMSSLGV